MALDFPDGGITSENPSLAYGPKTTGCASCLRLSRVASEIEIIDVHHAFALDVDHALPHGFHHRIPC